MVLWFYMITKLVIYRNIMNICSKGNSLNGKLIIAYGRDSQGNGWKSSGLLGVSENDRAVSRKIFGLIERRVGFAQSDSVMPMLTV